MIIKGQARGRAAQLAAHLLSADQNENVRLYECRGTVAQDVAGALAEMEARGLAGRSQRPLYHASISPEPTRPLNDVQISQAVDHLERRLGLRGQPRIIVVHRKSEREHIHVVWSRIKAEDGTAISYSWNYRLHEKAARELETAFGHRPVPNSGDKRGTGARRRPVADYELRQAERSGRAARAVTAELTALWHASSTSAEFRRKLLEAGYVLARGDRRVFVVIDQAGNAHSLARRIEGVDTAAVRARLRDVDLNDLPLVAAGRDAQEKLRAAGELHRDFELVARRVTQFRSLSRVRVDLISKQLRANLDCAVAVAADGWHTERPVVRRSSFGLRLAYRSAWAGLIAEYASRMAAARRNLAGDTLTAALEALQAERNAALDALQMTQPRLKKYGRRARLTFKRGRRWRRKRARPLR